MKLTLSLNSSAVEKLSPFLKYKFPAISLSAELVHIPFEKEKDRKFLEQRKEMVGRDLPRTSSTLMSKVRHEAIFVSLCLTLLDEEEEIDVHTKMQKMAVRREVKKVLRSAFIEYQGHCRTLSAEGRKELSTDDETVRRRKQIYYLLIQGINDPEVLLRDDLFELVLFYEKVLEFVK